MFTHYIGGAMKTKAYYSKIIGLFLTALICGSTLAAQVKQDPFESVNRKIYRFNKAIDAMYIKPISLTYSKVAPKPVKITVGNFINNMGDVPNTVNHFLQGKFKDAGNNLMRFLFNSTFGVCGIFDVASHMGFAKKATDFSQTLMYMGYKQSCYVVLPIIGPSTVRDGVGLVGNTFASVHYYLKPKWRNRYLIMHTLHKRAELQEEVVDILNSAGVDEYALVRDAYLQRREFLRNDGKPAANANQQPLQGPPD